MSVHGSQYQPIFSYLRSLNFHFLDTWVIECVNYYNSVNPNISLDVLKNEVKEQWLLVNLREIKVPCLPPALKSKDKIILNGNYAVQVESMIDCSVSCYSQFQKLFKASDVDAEVTEEPKKRNTKTTHKRCLTFDICDGVQEIRAMEYQPINKIKTNDPELLPGFKMVIIGPVECRKGMILLKDENVRICGGEVDTLTVSNSLKNLLIRKLELDESEYTENLNPSPSIEEAVQENSENQLKETDTENIIKEECVQSLLSQNDDVFLSLPLEPEILSQDLQLKELRSIQDEINEGDLINEDIADWNKREENQVNHAANSKKHSLHEEDMEMPSQKRLSLDTKLENNEAGSSRIQNPPDGECDANIFTDFGASHLESPLGPSKTKKPVQTKLSLFFKNKNSNSDRAHKASISHGKPAIVNSQPFVYLKHVMSIDLREPAVFTIKAIILTLKKKITIENDEFNLRASITDGSAAVDADFSSDILEDILGFSPCEMAAMLKAKQTNTAVAQRIKETFSTAQEKLISLNSLMEIKFFTEGKSPLILSLAEVTEQHLRALKDRQLDKQ